MTTPRTKAQQIVDILDKCSRQQKREVTAALVRWDRLEATRLHEWLGEELSRPQARQETLDARPASRH